MSRAMSNIRRFATIAVIALLSAGTAYAYTYADLYSNARKLHELLITIGVLDSTGLAATNGVVAGRLTVRGVDGGTVVITAADNDTNADLAVRPGGDGGLTLGGATTPTVTVSTDGTGNGEVVLPAGSIGSTEILDDTIEAADEHYAGRGQIVICGDATTVNNNTVYYGPITTVTATDIGGMDCDVSAAGNTTEATADAPAFTAKAFQVRGMICRSVDHNAAAGISYTLRTAAAATVPSVTCSIADNVLDCVADVQTTTAIASGATVAVAVASTNDVGAAAFVCVIDIAY